MKVNVREWGSYELAMSFDGHQWFHRDEDVFGSGWTMDQAGAKILIKYGKEESPDPLFLHWIGNDRLQVLKQLMADASEEPSPPQEPRLLMSGEVPAVTPPEE